MTAFLRTRLLHALVVLAIVNSLTFVLIRLAPGLPQIMTGDQLTNEDRASFARNLGLDQPIYVQFLTWWSHVLRGDLGSSWTEHAPVLDVLLTRLPNTLVLAASALVLAVALGIPAGIVTAVRPHSWFDYVVTSLGLFGLSMPAFWLGLMMILLLSVNLHLLPSAGIYTIGYESSLGDRLVHLIMPTFVLAASTLAQLIRFTRSSLIEVLGLDYIRTARAKGLRPLVVLRRHALKNALIPVITIVGLQIPRFIGGSIIVESVFAWSGVGRVAYSAAITRDYPMIMGVTIVISVVVVLSNLLTDLTYSFVDPRIRLD